MKQTLQKIGWIVLLVFGIGLQDLQAQSIQSPHLQNLNASEPGSMKGKITDAETGKALAGASLFFPDLRTGVIANANGDYHFNHIPSGTYILDITFQGYASRAITVQVEGQSIKDFQLSATVAENENVTVTGVSKATELRLNPTPVTIVKKSDLNRSTASNIIEALAREAGVSALSTGPAISKPFIRGLGYNRVITLNDGMRQEGQQWGDEHGIEIDEYSVQRAEIVKGPASLIYGSDAIGGVLNIQSAILVPANIIRANLMGSFNGNNRMWGSHADVAGRIGAFNFSAYGSSKSAGDYQNAYDGYVLNSRFHELNYGGSIGINHHWGYSHLSASYFNQKIGMVEGERDGNGHFLVFPGTTMEHTATDEELTGREILVPSQHVSHFKLAWDNNLKVGKGMLAAQLGYQQNQRREFGDPQLPETPDAFFDLKTFTYNIAYHFAEKAGWKTTIGISGMQQQNRNRAEEAIIPDYWLLDAGGYVLVQKRVRQKLNFSTGIRLDNRHLVSHQMLDASNKPRFEAFTQNFTNLSASIGASYLASKSLVIKANLSRGFRAPSMPELSSNGEHEGTNRYEIGRRDLKSETTLQADLGLEYSSTHFNLNLTPFYNHINNFIYSQKLIAVNGSDSLRQNDNGDLVTAYQFSQQNAKLYGLELGFDLHPHPLDWLHFENSVTLLRGKFGQAVDGSSNMPLIAPPRLFSELRGEWAKPFKAIQNLYLKLEMDANAAQNNPFTGYNTETKTPGYTLWNIGAGTDLSIKGKKWASVNLSLNNLADKSYQAHLGRLKYTDVNLATGRMGVYNMGRNFTARLIIPMEFKVKERS